MSKGIHSFLMDQTSSKYHCGGSFVTFDGHVNEDADFCLNKCPHPEKSCKGICEEYEEFYRARLNKNVKGANKYE